MCTNAALLLVKIQHNLLKVTFALCNEFMFHDMVCRLYGHDTTALGRPMIYFIEERNGPRIDIDCTSIDANVSHWHQSDTFALEPCPIVIDQRLFAILDGGRTCFTCHDRAFLSNAQSLTSKLHRIYPFTYKQSSWCIFSTATLLYWLRVHRMLA